MPSTKTIHPEVLLGVTHKFKTGIIEILLRVHAEISFSNSTKPFGKELPKGGMKNQPAT